VLSPVLNLADGARGPASTAGDRGMTEDTKPFTVKDRRHLNADGELREETATPEPAAARPDAAGETPVSDGHHEYPADFTALLVSLAGQAASFLSAEPPELTGARAFINLLETLEDKSEGRRSPEEDRVLKGLLFELRMGFVARSRSASR
jgi:hypothetical protein